MNLYEKRQQLIDDSRGIIDHVKAKGRDLTKSEDAKLEANKTEIDQLNEQIKSHEQSSKVVNQLTSMFQDGGGQEGPAQPFDGTAHQKNLADSLRMKQAYGFDVGQHQVKSLMTSQVEPLATYSDNNNLVHTNPGLAATSLRDLFKQEQAKSGLVRFYRLAYEGADVVAEGEQKPDAKVDSETVNAELKKIATTFKVSDELTEDAPVLFQSVTAEAAAAVLKRENQLIVETLAETPGIATASTTADNLIDAVADAIAEREADVGVQPGALVLSPRDFATLRQARASGSGQHLVNPFSEAPSTLFGMHLFPSNALQPGTAYAVSAGSGVFYYRGDLRIEAGFNGDDWVRNMVTVRAEERVFPAIVQPKRITRITIGGSEEEQE